MKDLCRSPIGRNRGTAPCREATVPHALLNPKQGAPNFGDVRNEALLKTLDVRDCRAGNLLRDGIKTGVGGHKGG